MTPQLSSLPGSLCETAWLTQAHLVELFQTTVPNIRMHLRNIYAEPELRPAAPIQEFLTVRQEGGRQVSRSVEYYNLDAIISVGYRVKSAVATRFRIWATQQLREFIVKGFVLDDERLKNPDRPFDYFDELLRRIQDIRTSERRFCQKITNIYATSEGLDFQAPRFPNRQRPQHPHPRRHNLAPDGQGTCRGGIRQIQPPADPADRCRRRGIRESHQTIAATA